MLVMAYNGSIYLNAYSSNTDLNVVATKFGAGITIVLVSILSTDPLIEEVLTPELAFILCFTHIRSMIFCTST